ncbi:MAG TPA: transporter substrate-binding domain-containing protein [Solirubrobacteraceae bacterium]
MSGPSSTRTDVRVVADPYPPYQYAEDGEVRGHDHELVVAAFAAVGLRATTQLLAWPECLQSLRDGAADAIFQITPTPEREHWLVFSRPFRSARTLLYQRPGTISRPIRVDELPALATQMRVGVLEGFSYDPVIDGAPAALAAPSDGALLMALRDAVVDLAVVDEGVAEHLLDGTGDAAPVPGFTVTRPLHLACRRADRAIVEAFDAGLTAIGCAPT